MFTLFDVLRKFERFNGALYSNESFNVVSKAAVVPLRIDESTRNAATNRRFARSRRTKFVQWEKFVSTQSVDVAGKNARSFVNGDNDEWEVRKVPNFRWENDSNKQKIVERKTIFFFFVCLSIDRYLLKEHWFYIYSWYNFHRIHRHRRTQIDIGKRRQEKEENICVLKKNKHLTIFEKWTWEKLSFG